MSRIIFTSEYLKKAPKKQIVNFINYMATRPGVAIDGKINLARPATENQIKYIRSMEKLVPQIKDTFEHEDFIKNPTIGNAKELMDRFVEENLDQITGIKNYVDYIAKRPRAERSAGSHGLWNGSDDKIILSKVAEEAASQENYIWRHVISLRREDAARLGYDNASAWRDLVKSKIPIIAEAMNIPIEDLVWYGSFHDEAHHPHVHLMAYSKNKHYTGHLKNPGIEKMRSAFGTTIFKQDLMHVYEQRTGIRKELNQFADEYVKKLIEQINAIDYENPIVQEMLVQLSKELKHMKGRKVYGNLKGEDKQAAKKLVDGIVTEISKDKHLAEIYRHWCDLQDEIKRTFMKNTPPPIALVDEKEFITIKNTILRYADSIDDVDMDALKMIMEEKSEMVLDEAPVGDSDFSADGTGSIEMPEEFSPAEIDLTEDASTPATSYYAKWTDEYKKARQHLYGKGAPQDYAKAYELFLTEAKKGNALAMYDVGKMHLAGLQVEMDETVAQEWFAKAHDAFVSVETATGKDYIQYRIGKLYNLGHGIEKDYAKAAEWFEKSAEQGNQFAQYSLGSLYFNGNGVEQSYENAFDLYSESYEQNNTFAAYELGKMYRDVATGSRAPFALREGIGTEIDAEESQECFAVAYAGFVKIERENGGDQLQHRLGQMCVAGEGTDVNIPKAVEYFKKAVELGNVHSMHALTKLHMDGKSDEIDINNLIEKLTKAAEKENDFAQFSLGRFYAFDKTERDMEKALHWLTKSAGQGNEYAAKLIEYLNNPQYQMSAGSAAVNLLRHMSKIIADDYQEQMRKYDAMIDKKLMKKIMQKKQEHGMKQTFE